MSSLFREVQAAEEGLEAGVGSGGHQAMGALAAIDPMAVMGPGLATVLKIASNAQYFTYYAS